MVKVKNGYLILLRLLQKKNDNKTKQQNKTKK